MFDLTGKVALVTGGRRGMGKAHALALAAQGAKVVVTDVDATECAAVVEEFKLKNGEAVCFKMDVSDKKEVDEVFDNIIKQFGRLDILVNNAGIFSPKPVLEISEEEWDRTVNINLKGEFLCAQRAAHEMAKNKWGRIINIASIASGGGGVGFPSVAHYCASKGGVVAFTEALADELAPLGILVNCIGPGVIATEMTEGILKDPKQAEALLARAPLKRAGKPEEIAS